MLHTGVACPRIKSIAYHGDGRVKKVKYFKTQLGPTAVSASQSSALPNMPTHADLKDMVTRRR
jgi:hypothetical protein